MIFQSLILRSGPKDRVSKDEAGTVRLRPSFETPASRAPQDEVRVCCGHPKGRSYSKTAPYSAASGMLT
jgi:hypothetical protein